MNKFITIFKIPELAQKIGITLLFLAIYRVGYHIPLPIVDQKEIAKTFGDTGSLGQLMAYATMFSGSNLGQFTIFGLGIMPYISASIIFQLLASVWEPLEKLQKEGESGRKKINEYTRYATVFICLIQSYMYVSYMRSSGEKVLPEFQNFFSILTAVITMTAGTIFMMWIGEQIDEYGIGNGISLIIMAGIVARIPDATRQLFFESTKEGWQFRWSVFQLGGGGTSGGPGLETLIVLIALFIGVVFAVIAITEAQRRIPTQSARHVRGRRVFGGQRQYLPLRLNQSGVMPVIFASSLLMIPMLLFQNIPASWAAFLSHEFGRQGYLYNILYIALIYFFCYFWTALTFNPKDMANNLRDHGSFIPGYRPGKRTSEYLERVMLRITYVGAAFLAVVAIIPTLVNSLFLDSSYYLVASFYGGTGLLIVVSVALDLVQKINSHMVMRNYPGLTED